MGDDDAALGPIEAKYQLVSGSLCGTPPSTALILAENGFGSEAKIAGSTGDDAQAVTARLMTPLEKSDGRRSRGVRDDAAFDGCAFEPGRRGGIACRTRGAPAVPLAPDQ
ncbi:hypothetical protein TomTYG75_26430 [Sphingobium sp. TomTYG75]